MPPTLNKCYAQVGRRRVASRDLRSYHRAILLWAKTQVPALSELCLALSELKHPRLSLDLTYHFPMSKILTKAQTPKRLDVTNRIKPLEDAVFALLGLDDCLVFKVQAEKALAEGQDETVTAVFFVLN